MEGLRCYSCTAEEQQKCHYARDGDGTDDPNDADPHDSWYGEVKNCSLHEEHCMISRTRMILIPNL